MPGKPCTIVRPAAAALLLAATMLTVEASAQSIGELRTENLDLKAQVRELTRELDAARSEIADLKRAVASLQRRLEAGAPPRATEAPSDTEPPRVTVDESKPSASPRALLRGLRESHRQRFEDTGPGDVGTPQRIAYLRNLEGWQKATERELRSRFAWHVRRVPDESLSRRRGLVTFVAVDPQTDVHLGEPFTARLPRSAPGSVADALRTGEVLVMKGVLHPAVTIDRTIEQPGPFNESVYIGPCALFGFTVDVNSLSVPEEEG